MDSTDTIGVLKHFCFVSFLIVSFNSTDTIGVLKQTFRAVNFAQFREFYRYNWSIETILAIFNSCFFIKFYRYNWSIETKHYKLLIVVVLYTHFTDTIGVLKLTCNHSCTLFFVYSTDTIGVIREIHN